MVKILLVEDDKSLREIYGVRLLAEGYDIVSAGDGEEALAMAIKDRPDLILSDVMMPKISGFDMLDILRSTTETKGIKVIMMTALSSEDQRQRGVALGADRYLVKSQVGIEDVVRTVHEVLADAPVITPILPPSTPAPLAPAIQAPTPMMPGPGPSPSTPVPAVDPPVPTPAVTPVTTPTPVIPVMAPAPSLSPTALPDPTTSGPGSMPSPEVRPTLPQPSAPFSTSRNTLADRVIEPLAQTDENKLPDFSNMINQELEQANPNPFADKPPVAPGSTATNIPPSPPSLNFEETPRSATPQLPPAPQPPSTGV